MKLKTRVPLNEWLRIVLHRLRLLPFITVVALSACFGGSGESAPPPPPAQSPPPPSTSPEIVNGGFETSGQGWSGLVSGNSEYFAPPDGQAYAVLPPDAASLSQDTGMVLEAGKTYALTLWARSGYSKTHLQQLQSAAAEGPPPPLADRARIRIEVLVEPGETVLTSLERDVSVGALQGAPTKATNDDGGNIWVDEASGFRHAFSENHFYQPVSSDPILDPWTLGDLPLAFDQPDMMAKAAAILPDGTRRLYGFNSVNPFCQGTGETCQAILSADVTGPGDPLYDVPAEPNPIYIVYNSGDEDPWVGDPHVFVDPDTDRIWLTFGGGTGIYTAELDPVSGYIMGATGPADFDANPILFDKIADWNGDEWTGDSEWFEGAAIHKHDDFYYLFTSAGNLGETYTIRMGRSDAPTGPYRDKQGRDMALEDVVDAEFGNSFFLGDEGDQLVPGHPHFWVEGKRTLMGFDYRTTKTIEDGEAFDTLAIREVFWEDGWPTVWTPVQLDIDADDFPAQVGSPLTVTISNTGDAASMLLVDDVDIQVE